MATNTLFLNDNVEIHFENDYFLVQAKNDIPNGTLILIEHVIHGNFQYLMSVVFQRRIAQFIIQAIGKKIELIVFGFEDNILVLGDTFSKFNHSCRPNCRMDIVDKYLSSMKGRMALIKNKHAKKEAFRFSVKRV